MTEKEKMLCGEFYDTRDLELRRLSNHAKNIMQVYNSLPAENMELRNQIICLRLALAVKMPVSISQFGLITVVISLSVLTALSI